jgi:hypothetical protein
MSLRYATLVALLGSLSVVGSCRTELPTNTQETPGLSIVMSATIDGVAWNTTRASVVRADSGVAIFASSGLGETLKAISLSFPAATGTYTVSESSTNVTGAFADVGGTIYGLSESRAIGTVTVTTITSTGVAGTFSIDLVGFPNTGPDDGVILHVTDGKFDVSFSQIP